MSDDDEVLPRLRQALTDVIGPDIDDSVCTGYVVIAEWSAGDGERWLTKTAGDINDDGPPIWTVKGWLYHALDTAQRDADHASDDEDE